MGIESTNGSIAKGKIANIFITKEIKRQFNDIPYLNEGKAKPDLVKAADQHSSQSMDNLIIPGILMALIPMLIGYILSIKILTSFALGTLLAGIMLSYYWGNAGEISSNAKHYIESGRHGGPGSHAHRHIRYTDQLGDAYKDVLSPSMNIFIKSVMIITGVVMLFLS